MEFYRFYFFNIYLHHIKLVTLLILYFFYSMLGAEQCLL